jgi:hypothetical protein
MSSHSAPVFTERPVAKYHDAVEHALDAYKQGKISEAEVYTIIDQALALMNETLRSNARIRIHALAGLRAPRGTTFVDETGR